MKRTILSLAIVALASCGGGDPLPGEAPALRGYALPVPDWSQATGKGTYIFVIDTGVRRTHRDFAGRLGETKVFLPTLTESQATYGDCSPYGGHGTGVASIAAKIAPEATIIPVIAVNCIGWLRPVDVIAAIDWVISQPLRPAVINLSLGGTGDLGLDEAVQRALDARIPVAVAAGNSGQDACLSTPARVPGAYTAGAFNRWSGTIPSWSNRGPCVDYFLPAVEEMVAWSGDDNGLAVGTGTSYAAPYAAAWAAKVLGYFPFSGPGEVKYWLDQEYVTSGLPPAGSQ